MAQTTPNYPHMTSLSNRIVLEKLIEKYGYENIVWPLVWMEGEPTMWYTYERIDLSDVNSKGDSRPVSKSGLSSHFVDYLSNPREIVPANPALNESVDLKYKCSYEYVIGSKYATVDIDYAWLKDGSWRGLEFTTFWKDFSSRAIVEDLTIKMNRRPSWQGQAGAHGIRKLIEAANDLGIEYYLVGVNTTGGVSNNIKTDGNYFSFRLTHEAIDNILAGRLPDGYNFGKFSEFLDWL